MKRTLGTLGLLALLVAAGCGTQPASPSASPTPSSSSPKYVTATVDRSCLGHHGVGLDTSEWRSKAVENGDAYPNLAAAMLANGDTIVAASATPTPRAVTIAEFKGPCKFDLSFGKSGTEVLQLPRGFSVYGITPLADGQILLTGGDDHFHSHWVVGELDAAGEPEESFGDVGFASVPITGDATQASIESNGDVVVGGDLDVGNGQSAIIELTTAGQQKLAFGVDGRAHLPEWHDGGLSKLLVEPDGDILALVGGGSMGCYGGTAVTLTPLGVRVPGFESRFDAALNRSEPDSGCGSTADFSGDVALAAGGFRLIGTAIYDCGKNGCDYYRDDDTPARLSVFGFYDDGDLDPTFADSGVSNLPGSMVSEVWALPQSDGSTLVATQAQPLFGKQTGQAEIGVDRVNASGSLQSVTSHGQPYKNRQVGDLDNTSLPVSNGHQAAIVSIQGNEAAVVVMSIPT